MNKEEIKFDHFKDIEELIQHLEMWYEEDDYYAYDRYFHLRDARIMGMYIYELQQKINKAIEYIEKYASYIDYLSIDRHKEIGHLDMQNVKELLEILGGKE